jgi:hypothetical protein
MFSRFGPTPELSDRTPSVDVTVAPPLNGDSNSEVPRSARVEWLICKPAQEFLAPIDCFGMLEPNVPRVCTAEELAEVFQHVAERLIGGSMTTGRILAAVWFAVSTRLAD